MNTNVIRKGNYRLLAGVLALGLGAGACSSDGGDGVTDDTITDDTTTLPNDTTTSLGGVTTGAPGAGPDNGGTTDSSLGGSDGAETDGTGD